MPNMITRFTRALLFIVLGLLLISSLTILHPPSRAYLDPFTGDVFGEGGVEQSLPQNPAMEAIERVKPIFGWNVPPVHDKVDDLHIAVEDGKQDPHDHDQENVHGSVIMPKLGNATAKAALGRATWKLLHTMTLRFPEHPTEDERAALHSFIHLTSRLYPCGECAAEFQKLLLRFPPQTSSRRSASLWLCAVHNEVNARLGHPIFDCAHLDDEYDCGCGEDPDASATSTSTAAVGSSNDAAPGSERKVLLQEMGIGGTGKEVKLNAKGEVIDVDDATGAKIVKGGR